MLLIPQKYYRNLFTLALPLIFAHVIEAFIPFINTLIAARISHDALAAMGVAVPLFLASMGFCWGTITALAIMSAHKLGTDQTDELGIILKTGLLLALLFSLPVILVFLNMERILLALGQNVEVAILAQIYFYGAIVSVFPGLAKFALLQFATALNKPRIVVLSSLVTVPLVILFNDTLVWGKYGFPALGMLGIGLGTGLAHLVACLGVFLYLYYVMPFREYLRQTASWRKYVSLLREQLRLGTPIGAMFIIEIAFFSVIALMMGWINTKSLAAHQIIMQWEFLSVMVAFGFAEAIIILVGRSAAAQNSPAIKYYVFAGVSASLLFMLLNAIVFWLVPQWLIGVDLALDNPDNFALISLSKQFFLICGFFIIINCLRIITSGGLRGLKDTQYPMWVALVAFWLCALPFSYFLAFTLDMQGIGLWLGIIIGVSISCILQGVRLFRKLQQV